MEGETESWKLALALSAMSEPAVTPTVGSDGSSSSTIEKLLEPLPEAPPERPVGVTLAIPTVTVSDGSSALSEVAVSVSAAVADAPAPPVNVTVGGLAARSSLDRLA